MAIFLTGLTESYAGSLPVVNGSYNAEVNGNMDAFMESFDDSLAIIEAMHAMDMVEISGKRKIASLMESGADSDEIEDAEDEMEKAMEASVKEIWGKIVDKIKALWAKIKEFFKSVLRFFDGLVMNASDFVKKYKADLLALDSAGKLKDFKAKIHTYTFNEFDKITKATKEANDSVDNFIASASKLYTASGSDSSDNSPSDEDDNIFDTEMDEFRGMLTGKTTVDADDFSNELYGLFRNKAHPSDTLTEENVRIGTIIKNIEETKKLQDKISAAQSNTDTSFSKVLNALEKLRKASESFADKNKVSDSYNIRYANLEIKKFTAQKAAVNMGINAYKSAISEALNAYKSVCISAFRYKAKK